MANEITVDALARMMALIAEDHGMSQDGFYAQFLLATRAHAALMAERAKEAPERVRCWMAQDGVITEKQSDADFWRDVGIPFTPGWFTPDTKGSTDD